MVLYNKGAKRRAKSNANYQRKAFDSVSKIFETSPTSVYEDIFHPLTVLCTTYFKY